MHIAKIVELDEVAEYLDRHQLREEYLKAVRNILSGNFSGTVLKKRKPKKNEIWQFRITKKYRAFCYFSDSTLVVFAIDDHQ
jgi:hypothetical protein